MEASQQVLKAPAFRDVSRKEKTGHNNRSFLVRPLRIELRSQASEARILSVELQAPTPHPPHIPIDAIPKSVHWQLPRPEHRFVHPPETVLKTGDPRPRMRRII